MFNKFNIGLSVTDYDSSELLVGYSKVAIQVSDEIEYTAGNDTGKTLTMVCPWGTQQMANDILNSIRGYQYQPYSATGAVVDPSMEAGDAIQVGDVYGGAYDIGITFGNIMRADISAPNDEEVDESTPYKSPTERKIERQHAETKATFRVQAAQISAEVSARETQGNELRASLNIQEDRIAQEVSDREAQDSELRATLTQQAGLISAKVSKTGGNGSSFEWVHDDNKIVYKSNGSEVFRIDASGVKVTGEIRATSGKIGGFDIQSNYLSYNGQTWGGTNTSGAYLGTSGLQLGKNFKVDMQGNLTAATGTFTGTTNAGNIAYGGDAGYFSGGGLSDYSIGGGKVAGSSLGTRVLTGGINTSLGYADFANGVFNGYSNARYCKAQNVVTTTLDASYFNFKDRTVVWKTIIDGNGKQQVVLARS